MGQRARGTERVKEAKGLGAKLRSFRCQARDDKTCKTLRAIRDWHVHALRRRTSLQNADYQDPRRYTAKRRERETVTLKRNFGIFDINETLLGRPIVKSVMRKAAAAYHYLYEAIGGEAFPGGGSQERAGHDHAEQGGLPIPRGCVFSSFGGSKPLWSSVLLDTYGEIDEGSTPSRAFVPSEEIDNDAKSLLATITAYASPGIDTRTHDVFWDCRLWVYWPKEAKGNATIRLVNHDMTSDDLFVEALRTPSTAEVEIEPNAKMQELAIKLPVGAGRKTAGTIGGDWWNRISILGKRDQVPNPNTTTLDIYGVTIHETVALSQPKSKGRLRYR